MKRVLSCLLICIAVLGLGSLIKKHFIQPHERSSEILLGNGRKSIAIHLIPGLRLAFSGRIHSEVNLSSNGKNLEEKFDISGDVVLRSYQNTQEGMLWGIKMEKARLFINDQEADEFGKDTGEIFYLTVDGGVTEFLINDGMDKIYVNGLKSIALALQLKKPNGGRVIESDMKWEQQEAGQNGVFDVTYLTSADHDEFIIKKTYFNLRNADGMRIGDDSMSIFDFESKTRQLSALQYQMNVRNQSSGLGIASKLVINLLATDYRSDLGETELLSSLRSRLDTVAPDQAPHVSEEERLEQLRKVIKGITPEQMLASVSKIQSLEDESVPDLLLRLEAMVALNKEFAVKLMGHLDRSIEDENFADQLSIVMGAFTSMNAADVESPLLDYSRRHQQSELITQQTAFALAELKGASKDVFHFLDDLAQSPVKELRTIGLLSLGTLGQQTEHAFSASNKILDGLRVGEKNEVSVYLAALSNTKNPTHIDVFASYIDSGVESHMEQALFGLKHIPGERSFSLISQVILNDPREGLIIEGIQALAGHIERKGCVDVLMQTFIHKDSLRVKMETLSILAAVAPFEPKVKDFLKEVNRSMIYDQKVAAFAGELLLTI
ncbi:hypothetical protein [Oligoflexus tunisiensis]|uniref:hypothetical protein n=1 Tax=Oligoflexus tunisiensis TaxID=708132 RepID=UPI00114CEF4D|nr:hypothetical protein [Oligoflexus tunisiensis]